MIYEGFAQFEIILANYFIKEVGEIVTFGIDSEPVVSAEGFNTIPDLIIDEVNAEEVDALIIPGGPPDILYGCDKLHKLIAKLDDLNKVVGGICSGVVQIAKSGILQGREYTTTIDINEYSEFDNNKYIDKNVVVDKNVITAKSSGYVDFAIEIGKMLDIYKDEDDLQETIEFFKYFDNKG